MSNAIYRNEILIKGETINAYSSFEWDGNFIGNVYLKDRRYESGDKQTWVVDFVDGMQSIIYKTTAPVQIIPIIDIG